MTTEKIKQHLLDNFEREEIKDIARHGCSGGIGGFIYYHETCAFHDLYEEEIWNMLYEDAQAECASIPQFIAGLNGQKDVGSIEQFKNLLCWYAVEREANEIINGDRNDE